jgi:hypothetical protein
MITAVPRVLKRLMRATLSWISAVWRSGSLAVGVSGGDALAEGL